MVKILGVLSKLGSKRMPALVGGLFLSCFLFGCETVPAYQQQLLSKANMAFDDDPLVATSTTHQSLFEQGAASSLGGVSTGCAACR